MRVIRKASVACALTLVFAPAACGESALLIAHSDDGAGAGGTANTGGRRQTGGGSAATGGTAGSTGGSVSTGGSFATGGGAGCAGTKPCGGNVVGTWTVTSSCLTVAASLDFSPLGLSCPAPKATGSLEVQGSWTATSSGTFKDDTLTRGTLNFALSPACLRLSGSVISCDAIGPLFSILFGNASCRARGDGGCDCAAVIKQSGSLGTIRMGSGLTSGTYIVAGSTLVTDGDTKYDYCVTGDSPLMTLAPRDQLAAGFISLRRTGG